MSFFTIPYQIHFEDTMAYGSHHYLTNFRFQCAAREAFYFGPGLDGKNRWRDDLANLVMLTYEGYSRNLAPVRLGDKLALLLTYGEVSRSSLQLCVRAVKEDGTPVTVGFQRILCVEKDTKEFLPVPESLAQYYGIIDEPLTGAGFVAAALEGGSALKKLFTAEICALGKQVTDGKHHGATFIDLSGKTIFEFGNAQSHQPDIALPKDTANPSAVLVLPGQGSYQRDALRSLYDAYPGFHSIFADATEFQALTRMFGSLHDDSRPAIALGSVKATVGHTGWLAGAASIIKLSKSMEQSLIPAQHLWSRPSDRIDLAQSPFSIGTTAQPWLPNTDGQPRRAGVDGFGFGGTNAHMIVEQYLPAYHDSLPVRPSKPLPTTALAIVGIGSLFPNAQGGVSRLPASGSVPTRFAKSALGLPSGKPLLPDAIEQMDTAQLLALLASEQALRELTDWQSIAESIAVVVGIEGKTALGVSANQRIFKDRLFRQLNGRRAAFPVNDSEWTAILEWIDSALQSRNRPSGPYTLPGCMPNVVAGRVANYFNLKGPNLVIDKGAESLAQTLEVATQLLRNGDCKLALLGAINAHGGDLAALSSPRGAKPVGEAAVMLAVTTPEEVAEHGWPVLGTVVVETAATTKPGDTEQTVGTAPWDYRGAEGVVELMAALDRVQSGQATTLRWGHAAQRQICLRPSEATHPETTQHSGFVTGTPIVNYTPTIVPEPLPMNHAALSLTARHILFLTDDPQGLQAMGADGALDGLSYRIAGPAVLSEAQAITIDTGSEASLADSLRNLADFSFDTVIAVCDLSGKTGKSLLEQPWDSRFVELIFAVARHAYEKLATGQAVLGALCLGGTNEAALLDPETGLVAGFFKSLIRELPEATCRIVHTSAVDLKTGLQELAAELGDGSTRGLPVEACYLAGRRHVLMLADALDYATLGQPLLNASSVVVATGGGRGVTAVLVESMLESIGCTVVLLGRTDLSAIPASVLAMDDETFRDYETVFYREQMTRQPGARLSESKQRYQALAAARELQAILRQLNSLPGTVIYRAADITDRDAVDRVIADIVKEQGRIDLVVHGAGIQVSRRLPKKNLAEIRGIIATKVSGLQHIYQACQRQLPNRAIHYHLLTSAFSVMGNDGQPDYGAANEALNRIAA